MNEISLYNVLPNVFVGTKKQLEGHQSDVWETELTLHKGHLYLLEANSGTGKSSLCSFIFGYRHDYQGKIMFDNKDASMLDIKHWTDIRKKHIAILWQELRLFPELTAMENVEIKNNLTGYQSKEKINQWFEQLDIADRKEYKIGKMSFGQQQRVALIRSLCQSFDFLFADEPTSHLDDENSRIMGEIMMEEAKKQGAGVIVTSIGKHMDLNYEKRFKL